MKIDWTANGYSSILYHFEGEFPAVLYDAGWDETAVTHAALVCAYFNFMNRWVDGLGIKADPAVVQIAADMLHKDGYAAVITWLEHAPRRGKSEKTP